MHAISQDAPATHAQVSFPQGGIVSLLHEAIAAMPIQTIRTFENTEENLAIPTLYRWLPRPAIRRSGSKVRLTRGPEEVKDQAPFDCAPTGTWLEGARTVPVRWRSP